MAKYLITSGLIAAVFAGMLLSSQRFDKATLEIMPFVDTGKNSIYCTRCHSFTDRYSFQDVTNICDQMCVTCHKELEEHHKTGMIIEKNPGPAVKLRKDGTLACVSCHDLTLPRWDLKPWKSQSLFGAMFGMKKKHHTYYLVERNNNGQLCDRCH